MSDISAHWLNKSKTSMEATINGQQHIIEAVRYGEDGLDFYALYIDGKQISIGHESPDLAFQEAGKWLRWRHQTEV